MARGLLHAEAVFVDQLTNADSIPALEAMVQFAGQRQKLIAHNIANLSTPNFQPQDVSVADFRDQLADAVERRRDKYGGTRGDLEMRDTRQVRQTRTGLRLTPESAGRNIMFHDRNNRDLERTMQDLVENVGTFRVASELLKTRMELIQQAISERV